MRQNSISYPGERPAKRADIVERLTAENAALREKQRWISVTEKTPEYDVAQLPAGNCKSEKGSEWK